MRKNNFPATVVIVIIFFGAIFALSGLCTGLFVWEAEFGEASGYSPNHWYEALFIGSFALIPSGLMLWAASRQMRRGNNKISAIIFLIAGILGILFGLFILMSGINSYIRMSDYAARAGRSYDSRAMSWSLIFTFIFVAFGAWFIRVGFKTFRHKSVNLINPETFD